jgi:hypothetical protein
MRQPKTDDPWRLRLVELLLPDWLLAPHQVGGRLRVLQQGQQSPHLSCFRDVAYQMMSPLTATNGRGRQPDRVEVPRSRVGHGHSNNLVSQVTRPRRACAPAHHPPNQLPTSTPKPQPLLLHHNPKALAILSCFDPDVGSDQRIIAAQLAYARLADPPAFWASVMPAALKPLQQAAFAALAAPWLTALDRSNLTGRYVLNLGRPLDRCTGRLPLSTHSRCVGDLSL